MTQNAIATAADYADGIITARKTKNLLVAVLLVMLAAELTLFFVARYGRFQLEPAKPYSPTNVATISDHLHYIVGGIEFLGVIVPALLAIDLLLIANIMLVGRLIGLSKVISAFFGACLLALLLFPWQAILINESFTTRDFIVPGILYTFADIQRDCHNHPHGEQAVLYWGRYVAWPLAAIVILVWVGLKSGRGLRLAMGEASPNLPVDKP